MQTRLTGEAHKGEQDQGEPWLQDADDLEVTSPQHALRGQIRSTFLLALAWKRWQEALMRARALGRRRQSLSPGPNIPTQCRPPTPPRRQGLPQRNSDAAGPVRAVHPVDVATPTRLRPDPGMQASAIDLETQRTAARLLAMVLRAPAVRSASRGFSAWQSWTAREAAEETLLQAKLQIKHREEALAEAAKDMEKARAAAQAQAQLQDNLRALESSGLRQDVRLRGLERIVQVAARCFSTRRSGYLTWGLGRLQANRQVAIAVEEQRRKMATELDAFMAEDAQVSGELMKVAEAAKTRAKNWALSNLVCHLSRATQRQHSWALVKLGKAVQAACMADAQAAVQAVRRSSARAPSLFRLASAFENPLRRHLRSALELLQSRSASSVGKETSEVPSSLPSPITSKPVPEIEISEVASSAPQELEETSLVVSEEVEDVAENNRSREQTAKGVTALNLQKVTSIEEEISLQNWLPLGSPAKRLAKRADSLLRLKVRLAWHADFTQRCSGAAQASSGSVPMAPRGPGKCSLLSDLGDVSRSATEDVEDEARMILKVRLDRGAACLLEYCLASALRSHLRAGLNALLSSAAASTAPQGPQLRRQRQTAVPSSAFRSLRS
mmetsp:Transcript_17732/g.31023  ORF Transcript_17732/g.31023 Transcript_17732/m.31023 type:complete len:613 (+) Transcript_17732:68-1906(+)